MYIKTWMHSCLNCLPLEAVHIHVWLMLFRSSNNLQTNNVALATIWILNSVTERQLFREAKFLLATMFNSCSVVHVTRSCNTVAHNLARYGRGRDPDHPVIWMYPLPDFVNDLLVRDRTAPWIKSRALPSKKKQGRWFSDSPYDQQKIHHFWPKHKLR